MIQKKLATWCLLLVFLLQTSLAPAVDGIPPVNERPQTDELSKFLHFDPNVSEIEKRLIGSYLEAVASRIPVYTKILKLQPAINEDLRRSVPFWDAFFQRHPEMEARAGSITGARDYLLKNSPELEQRLSSFFLGAADRFEEQKTLTVGKNEVAEGLLRTAGDVDSGFKLFDSTLNMKNLLLFQYTATGLAILGEIKEKQQLLAQDDQELLSHLENVSRILDQVEQLSGQIEKDTDGYRQQLQQYNQLAITRKIESNQRIASLREEIVKAQNRLKSSGNQNSINHATLLGEIVKTLDLRSKKMARGLAIPTSDRDPASNFLHIPAGLGQDSPAATELVKSYEKIATTLVQNSQQRLQRFGALKEKLSHALAAHEQQRSGLNTLLAQEKIGQDKDESKNLRSLTESITDRLQGIIKIEDALAGIRNKILQSDASAIVANQEKSQKLIEINQALEDVVRAGEELNGLKLQFDLRATLLLEGLKKQAGYTDESPAIAGLLNANEIFTLELDELNGFLKAVNASLAGDRESFNALQQLAKKALLVAESKTGESLKQLEVAPTNIEGTNERVIALRAVTATALTREKGVLGHLTWTLAQADTRSSDSTCTECGQSDRLWNGTVGLQDSLTDVIKQIAGIDNIHKLFEGRGQSDYDFGLLLFSLGDRLGIFPDLFLHEQSIDIYFTIGGKNFSLKGIGDPDQLLLAGGGLPSDPIIDPPYIGGGFYSAYNAFGKSASAWVSATADLASKTTVLGIEGFRVVKGKITTGVSFVDNAFGNPNAFEATLKVFDYALQGAKCFAGITATAATAGAAVAAGALACAPLAILVVSDIGRVWVNLQDEQDGWDEERKERVKLYIDVAEFVSGGALAVGQGWKDIAKIFKNKGSLKGILKTTAIIAGVDELPELFKSKNWGNAGKSIRELLKAIGSGKLTVAKTGKLLRDMEKLRDGLEVAHDLAEWANDLAGSMTNNGSTDSSAQSSPTATAGEVKKAEIPKSAPGKAQTAKSKPTSITDTTKSTVEKAVPIASENIKSNTIACSGTQGGSTGAILGSGQSGNCVEAKTIPVAQQPQIHQLPQAQDPDIKPISTVQVPVAQQPKIYPRPEYKSPF